MLVLPTLPLLLTIFMMILLLMMMMLMIRPSVKLHDLFAGKKGIIFGGESMENKGVFPNPAICVVEFNKSAPSF